LKYADNGVMLVMLLVLACYVISVAHAGATCGTAKVCVHPSEIRVKVGEVFEVHVNISDVSRLQGFDFMLKYNTAVLDCLALEEGAFLSSFGDTFVAKQEISDECGFGYGRVWLAVAILKEGYADGSGTLAVIRFNATAVGESVLDLYSDYPYKPDEVKLTTCSSQAISNVAEDGYIIVDFCSNDSNLPKDPVNSLSPDINQDRFINVLDLAMIACAYGSSNGNGNYDVAVDLDENGIVDIRDVAICAVMFGQTV